MRLDGSTGDEEPLVNSAVDGSRGQVLAGGNLGHLGGVGGAVGNAGTICC